MELNQLTQRQERLLAMLYDDLITFKLARTKSHEEIRAQVFDMIFKIDAFIENYVEGLEQ